MCLSALNFPFNLKHSDYIPLIQATFIGLIVTAIVDPALRLYLRSREAVQGTWGMVVCD